MNKLSQNNFKKLKECKKNILQIFTLADEELLEKKKIEETEEQIKKALKDSIEQIDDEKLTIKLKKINAGWTTELKSGFHNRDTAENRMNKFIPLINEVMELEKGKEHSIHVKDSIGVEDNVVVDSKTDDEKDVIGGNGFGDTGSINPKEVEICKNWISEWIVEQKKINKSKGSYGLKHLVEDESKTYISNGAFIKGAIELGYEYERDDLNAFFNMSFVKIKNIKFSNENEESIYKVNFTKEGAPKRLGDNIEPVIGAKELAEEILEIIATMNDNKGSMFGIFGKWGRGKTFLVNQIKKKNQVKEEFVVIDFQAWKYQNSPGCWAYLYEQIAEKYYNQKIKFKTFKINWLRYGPKMIVFALTPILLSFIFKFFIGWRQFFLIFGYSWGIWSLFIYFLYGTRLIEVIKKYFIRYKTIEYLGIQHEIQEELKMLLKVWFKNDEKKILLIVDDVDRCSEEKIIEVVDSLRVMLEDDVIHKKITVLLSIDERILKIAIKHKYSKISNLNNESVGEFDIDEIMREYMDKLFLCGIRLGELNGAERTEVVYAITKKIIIKHDKEGNSFFDDNNKKEDNSPIELNKEEKAEFPSKSVDKDELTIEEGNAILEVIEDIAGITPRQIDIFIFRYLLARNILNNKKIDYRENDICAVMAEYMNSKNGIINESKIVDNKTERVLEMVITY